MLENRVQIADNLVGGFTVFVMYGYVILNVEVSGWPMLSTVVVRSQ